MRVSSSQTFLSEKSVSKIQVEQLKSRIRRRIWANAMSITRDLSVTTRLSMTRIQFAKHHESFDDSGSSCRWSRYRLALQ